MRVIAWLGSFLFLGCTTAFCDSWRGFLVDAKCYEALERNHNPTDTSTAVDEDKGQMIRYCSPKAKTKLFAIVEEDGRVEPLDPGGAGKAAELIRKAGKREMLNVVVTGSRSGGVIQTETISVIR